MGFTVSAAGSRVGNCSHEPGNLVTIPVAVGQLALLAATRTMVSVKTPSTLNGGPLLPVKTDTAMRVGPSSVVVDVCHTSDSEVKSVSPKQDKLLSQSFP